MAADGRPVVTDVEIAAKQPGIGLCDGGHLIGSGFAAAADASPGPARRPRLAAMAGRGAGRAFVLALLLSAVLSAIGAAVAEGQPFTKRTLHFDVVTGPAGNQHCNIVGDLYRPASATAAHPAPAILTTNGFGGSKDDQADIGRLMASRGYVVLSYSGLGFGGSTCKITLDDRDYDGKAGSQLVTFLGGGKKAVDGTKVNYVRHDRVAHDGHHHAFDPRVGMIGGSYGGQIQFAIAGIDPRVDTIIPIITWNDLAYSLAPNNTSFAHGVTYQTPGIEKFEWTSLFFGLGIADGIEGGSADPSRNVGCPNFDNRACGSKAQMDATGAPNDATLLFARHASVESFINKIRIPTLLSQGQTDTLFNLQEAIATYRALRAKRVPVKMVWRSSGHSGGDVPGMMDHNSNGDLASPWRNYETRTYLQWFDHYLGLDPTKPPLDVQYFRDWVKYKGDATPAVARSRAYPFGPRRKLYLSGGSSLVPSRSSVKAGSATFTTPSGGAPTSYTETSAIDQSKPVTDAPGTFAEFLSPPLKADTFVIGVPTADVTINAPTFENAASAGGAPSELVLFFKLYDVKPNGTVVLQHRLIAPVRIADFSHRVHVELPGIVKRFDKGDRFALTIAASDAAYRGNNVSGPVTIDTSAAAPGVLSLPLLGRPLQGKVRVLRPTSIHSRIERGPVLAPDIGTCLSGKRVPFTVQIAAWHGVKLSSVSFFSGARKLATISGRGLHRTVHLSGLPRHAFTLRALLRGVRGGHHVHDLDVRRYSACGHG